MYVSGLAQFLRFLCLGIPHGDTEEFHYCAGSLVFENYIRSLVRAFLGPSKKRTSQKTHH